jgi:hypothetical protein
MRVLNDVIMNAASLGASTASDVINCEHKFNGSIQLVWTGTPTGDFTIELSNDYCTDQSGSGVSNWTTMSDTTVAAGGASGNHMYLFSDITWKWMRVVYTRSASTGSVTARTNLKWV